MAEPVGSREETRQPAPRRRGGLGAWLELVRVFLTPSAVADSWAGMVLAGFVAGANVPDATIAGVALCSVLTFWFGLVANDLFDLQKDRLAGARRPLVRGDIPVRSAVLFATALAGGAGVAAAWTGVLGVWLVLAGAVLAYDAGGKRMPLVGNLLMGCCRALNLVLGAAAVLGAGAAFDATAVRWGAGALGVYVAAVTAVSSLEDRPFARGSFLVAALSSLVVPVTLVALAPARWAAWGNAALLTALVVVAVRGGLHAPQTGPHGAGPHGAGPHGAGPHGAGVFVRTALGGIFLVDAGILIAVAPPGAPLAGSVAVLYSLLALAWLWKRRWIRAGAAGS